MYSDSEALTPQQMQDIMLQAMQGNTSHPLDFSQDSVSLALVLAGRAAALELQKEIEDAKRKSRLRTSKYADKLTFVDDFNYNPPPPNASIGNLIFSRSTPANQAVVPVGTIVQAQNNPALQVQVIADPSNPQYNAGLMGYVIPPGSANSGAIPAICLTTGAIGNAVANTYTVLATGVTGINTVTNPAAFTGGEDNPDDEELIDDFEEYLAGLGNATPAAIKAVVRAIQDNLDVGMVEFEDINGNKQCGYFYVLVSDGSPNPPAELLTKAEIAINSPKGRAGGIEFDVFFPVNTAANITADIVPETGYSALNLVDTVTTAINNFIFTYCKIGVSLPWSILYEVIYDAAPGIKNAKNLLINGVAADLNVIPKQKITPGTITISPTT